MMNQTNGNNNLYTNYYFVNTDILNINKIILNTDILLKQTFVYTEILLIPIFC